MSIHGYGSIIAEAIGASDEQVNWLNQLVVELRGQCILSYASLTQEPVLSGKQVAHDASNCAKIPSESRASD